MGEYDPFEHAIYIYVCNCKTVGELVKTLIHEYTHSTQRVMTEYQKMYKKYGYQNHPLEIAANEAEKRHIRVVMRYIRENW